MRPNPDALLKVATDEAAREGRGRLKIFFGACAGVGKTYAMLHAAREQKTKGISVGVGAVETHDRDEIQEMLAGLPAVTAGNRDHKRSEFDLDAALGAGFQLLLVDELAYSNGSDSRHSKRWQDVEELLDAGIDIYTTLNVQHLDSLSDVVGGIIGVRIRETIPDRMFDTADDVILVDLSPDDLLARLDAGQIHLPVSVAHARQNFFRKGNLIALRELALRRMADRVNSDVHSYRVSNAIPIVWPTRERLMVCVRADWSQERLLRETARLAQSLEADWIAVHVNQPANDEDHRTREVLLRLAKSAESLGAEFSTIPGKDIAGTLLDYARARNATKLVMGHGAARRNSFWRRPLTESIARDNPEIGLILLGPDPISIERPWSRCGHGKGKGL